MKCYHIAIVESSPIILAGVEAILSQGGDVDVVLKCSSLSELAARMRGVDIDVVLVSVVQSSEIASFSELYDVPLVGMQSALCAPDILRRYASVVTLYSSYDELIAAVRQAVDSPVEKSHADSHELSERERDVLVLVARGYTNKEIASELNISPHTVISHRKNIVHKTGIRSVAGLTVYAVLNRLIESE
ncbi:MAG: response regulator transcription factor [Alistipes sp.]|nr:response regulator transcription factor [Alistipes sp.]